jgi:hypothetical protein
MVVRLGVNRLGIARLIVLASVVGIRVTRLLVVTSLELVVSV